MVGDEVRVLTFEVGVIFVVGLIATVINVGAVIGRAIVTGNAGHCRCTVAQKTAPMFEHISNM